MAIRIQGVALELTQRSYPKVSGGTILLTNETIKAWPTKRKIDEIIFGYGALGDYGNYTKIKFALYDMLERLEELEKNQSLQGSASE